MATSRVAAFAPLLLLAASASACALGSTRADEPVSSSSAPLLGAFSTSGCNPGQIALLGKALLTGRFLSQTAAFQSCVTGGAYRPCFLDDDQSPAALLPATRSTNDLEVECTDLGPAEAGAVIPAGDTQGSDMHDYGYAGTEVFTVNTRFLDFNGAQLAPAAQTPADVMEIAKTLWHEAMHVHGYKHGSGSDDNAAQYCGYPNASAWNWQGSSAPYVVSNCIFLEEAVDPVMREFLSIGSFPTAAQSAALWARIESDATYSPAALWNDVHTIPLPAPGVAGRSSTASGPQPVYRIFVPTTQQLDLTLTGLPATTSAASIQVLSGSATGPVVFGGAVPSGPSSYEAVTASLAPGWYFVAVHGDIQAYTLGVQTYGPPAPTGCSGAAYCIDSIAISCGEPSVVDSTAWQLLERMDPSGSWQIIETASPRPTVNLSDAAQPAGATEGLYRVCFSYQPTDVCSAPFFVSYSTMACQTTGSGGGGSVGGSGGAYGCAKRVCLE